MLGLVIERHEGIADESLHQQPLRRFGRKPARRHVEARALVQLADGRAMRAFHVVGENFELRHGIGARALLRAASP